ncbi:hypothetical protein EYF80_031564 [Liparis tanakae]|uniref:Uncharacterized protein n=1 Tax=Liparis tanakae TaxID=230148 RepID=A0A4Z2H033_9TELE|nr:hypothetical protein EYF80_031564 [Liparis tanakae]
MPPPPPDEREALLWALLTLLQEGEVKVLLGNNGSQRPTLGRKSPPHHDGLQEADDGAEATPLLHEGPAHRLLLRLLHQQTQVRHILHGAVHLGLQVHSPWGGGRG